MAAIGVSLLCCRNKDKNTTHAKYIEKIYSLPGNTSLALEEKMLLNPTV